MVIFIDPISPKIREAITANISFINMMERGYKRSIKIAEREGKFYINSGSVTEVFKINEHKNPGSLVVSIFKNVIRNTIVNQKGLNYKI